MLSYGLCKEGFSLNLHDIKNKLFLQERKIGWSLDRIIMLNCTEFVSLSEIRTWNKLSPGSILGNAISGVAMKNKIVCLGDKWGNLFLLSKGRLHEIV